ncbi:Fic/DOC family protein [Methanolapillus africanus]|uniref:Fic/DOC family protein n=1 Tax=Methanolapillus africanus TaxID=3028297 RepID=UPI0030B8B4BC
MHKYLFEDIYTWVGEIRNCQFLIKGESIFCRADFIHVYADTVFNELKSENYLQNMEYETFIGRCAYYMGEINALHPFRDGNGRVQRIFFQELARRVGYNLNFAAVDKDDLLEADIASFNKNYEPLRFLLEKMVQKV